MKSLMNMRQLRHAFRWVALCFERLQSTIPKLCVHTVAFYLIHSTYLLGLNKGRAVFCVYKPCLNFCIVLSFSYLKVRGGGQMVLWSSHQRWVHKHTNTLRGHYFGKLLFFFFKIWSLNPWTQLYFWHLNVPFTKVSQAPWQTETAAIKASR